MTLLKATEREPAVDICAQFDAYRDPNHPKRAVWVSAGTPLPLALAQSRLPRLELPAGMLFADIVTRWRLEECPTEEVLASILDYLEPKTAVISRPFLWLPVLQARTSADRDSAVVFEMIAGWERMGEAMRHVARYGRLKILTPDEVLRRRARLIALEESHAEGIKGRPGRDQAEAGVSR